MLPKQRELSPQLAAAIIAADRRKQARRAVVAPLQLHDAQARVVANAQRYNVVCCGRRWGKTELGMELASQTALDGKPAGWFAPNFKYLTEAWRDSKKKLQPVTSRKSEQEKRIELTTGGVIEFWTLEDPDAGRSRAYDRVIIDEAAKVGKLQEAWEEAIRATLSDYQGDAWFLSTPKGRNYFFHLFNRGVGSDGWTAWQMPTSTNPYIKPEEIDDARLHLPQAAFLQEYMAEFTEDAGLVFRNVRNCLRTAATAPEEYHTYIAGVDWGQSNDFTAIMVIDTATMQVVDIDRFNQIGWAVQRGRLMAMCDRWNVRSILAEQNSFGGPNIEQLQSEGLPVVAFNTTSQSKQDIVVALQLAFERGEIGLPAHHEMTEIVISELEAYEAKRLPSGKWQYNAPDGMHDDTVIALALAWYAAQDVYEDAGGINYGTQYRVSSSSY